MRRALSVPAAILLAALAFFQASCQSGRHTRRPPEERRIKLVSDPVFIRTSEGDYVDGYLAESELRFLKETIFVSFEIARYAKGDRLILTGRLQEATVRIEHGDRVYDAVPLFSVDRASPNIPAFPDVPIVK